jgi:hemin uptake protein HemP
MPLQDSGRVSPTRSPDTQPSSEGMVKLPKLVSFSDLCRCGDEVWIENDGQIYRLRRTKLGKLILTK